MSHPFRARRAVLVLAAGLVVGALTAPTASAAESQCPSGSSCVWTDSGYTGSYSNRRNADYNEWHAVGGFVFNDSISSLKNRSAGRTIWYEDTGRGGAQLWVSAGDKISNLQNAASGRSYHPNWNDFISSVG